MDKEDSASPFLVAAEASEASLDTNAERAANTGPAAPPPTAAVARPAAAPAPAQARVARVQAPPVNHAGAAGSSPQSGHVVAAAHSPGPVFGSPRSPGPVFTRAAAASPARTPPRAQAATQASPATVSPARLPPRPPVSQTRSYGGTPQPVSPPVAGSHYRGQPGAAVAGSGRQPVRYGSSLPAAPVRGSVVAGLSGSLPGARDGSTLGSMHLGRPPSPVSSQGSVTSDLGRGTGSQAGSHAGSVNGSDVLLRHSPSSEISGLSNSSARKKKRRKRKKKSTRALDSSREPLLARAEAQVPQQPGAAMPLARKRSHMYVTGEEEESSCQCEISCGACKCNVCSRGGLATLAIILLVLGAGVAVGLYIETRKHVPTRPNLPLGPSTPSLCTPPADPAFNFWNGLVNGGDWWTPIDVNNNISFMSRLSPTARVDANQTYANASDWLRVHIDWANHYAIQLFGNPAYLQSFDDAVREWNPNAHDYSGTIDSCGWPLDPAGKPGYTRASDCFWEDFRHGWNDSRVKISLAKSCCIEGAIQLPNLTYYPADPTGPNPPLPFEGFVNVTQDVVEYPQGVFRTKNVLDLIAMNEDNQLPDICGNCDKHTVCPTCHKRVAAAGAVQTAELFASGRYDVLAKVPAASGLVWAVWTYHHEDHLVWPSCSDHSCYLDGYRGVDPDLPPAAKVPWTACCGNITGCCLTGADRPANCPPASECPCCTLRNTEGGCATETLCDKYYYGAPSKCARNHTYPDPQAAGNSSMGSWKTLVNHEIDIEIPANCEGTTVCGETALPSWNFTERDQFRAGCINRLNTLNMNNYIQTNNGGTGPAYSNMCAAAFKTTEDSNKTEIPFQLIGDGRYHKYTIDWHTGGVDCDGEVHPGRVDFFVDDVYMGTNNVFVPTRASRLVMSNWASTGHYTWNNWPDNWGGGKPNDGVMYLQHTYISEIRVTPHNEPNDIVYPMSYDQPDGCIPFYDYNASCHKYWVDTGIRDGPLANPQPGVLGAGCAAPPP